MKINFKNKIVLITGSSGKIGRHLSNFFQKEKCKVYGIDHISSNKSNSFVGDIYDEKFVQNVIKKIIKKHKHLDILINNAGKSVFSKPNKRTLQELQSVMNTNLVGTINLINSFIKFNPKRLDHYKIINISSIYGVVSPNFEIYGPNDNFNSEIYGATKAGIIQLSKYYTLLAKKKKININSISPGGIEDPKHSNYFKKKYISNVPLDRMGKVDDLIGAIALLSSSYSDYISGQNVIIDGGLTAC